MPRKTPPFKNYPLWTNAAFFGKLRQAIRRMSANYPPVREAKKRVRRKYVGPNKRQKWEFQCQQCKGWFSDKQTSVDHIIPAGTLRSFDDVQGFCERLFCSIDGLQVLCDKCHKIKTDKERGK